jgi:hypothetical protein
MFILGGLFNESWVELDAEVKALERRRGKDISLVTCTRV